MTVSLLDVLVSGRPDRPVLRLPRSYRNGRRLAATVLATCLAGLRARSR